MKLQISVSLLALTLLCPALLRADDLGGSDEPAPPEAEHQHQHHHGGDADGGVGRPDDYAPAA